MGLNLILYNFRDYREGDNWYDHDDDRFDYLRHREDYDFVAWLNARNAVFKIIGPPDELVEHQHLRDAGLRRVGEPVLDESLEQYLERLGGEPYRHGFVGHIQIFERPKDFAAARAWVRDYIHPYPGHWDRKRFEDLLDLMEGDEDLWLYESQ